MNRCGFYLFFSSPTNLPSMKKAMIFVILTPVLLLLMGCPVDTKFPFDTPGALKIDKNLLGTWKNPTDDENADVLKVKISKKDNFSYDVIVLEKGDMYMADTNIFVGYVSELDGKTFFYLQSAGRTDKNYLYHYTFDGKQLITHDVGLKVGGIDAITSTEAFRKEVSASLPLEDCLTGEIKWEKVDR